jgi:hypothetical protein
MRLNFIYCKPVATFVIIAFMLVFVFDRNGRLVAQSQDQGDPATSLPGQGNTQNAGNIEAVPNRPTFSTTAETVMRGVFELEYGFELTRGHQNINGLLKFGLFKNLEIRFGNNPVLRDASVAGFGDSGAGFKYRFLKDKGALPTLSMLYTLTIPTATAELGSGAVGHSAGLLVSQDFGRHHLDFNETVQWLGRDGAGGFDRNYFTALAYSHPITGKLAFSEEIAGFTRTNATTGPTLTILQALTYSVAPRLVLDGGCYVAAIGDLPRATFFAGVTYAVGDLYRHLRHSPHPLPAH